MARIVGHLPVAELEARYRAARDATEARHFQAIWLLAQGRTVLEVAEVLAFVPRWVIPTPADQLGWFGLGHQWKSVCGWMVLASRRRQRSATVALSASSVAKCVLTTASSTSGQRCSAGCSSGV